MTWKLGCYAIEDGRFIVFDTTNNLDLCFTDALFMQFAWGTPEEVHMYGNTPVQTTR